MHEFSIMSYLLELVEDEARRCGAKRVVAINLVMGERASVFDDSLLFHFDLLTPGSVAEGAQLNVRRTRMSFHCDGCGVAYVPAVGTFECPACGKVGTMTGDGSERLVESIEIETDAP